MCLVRLHDLQPGREKGIRFKTCKMTHVMLQLQATNDQMNALVMLIFYFICRWRLFKPVLEISRSLSPVKPLFCEKNYAVNNVLLKRWKELQQSSRNCELELRKPGLKYTQLKFPCTLYMFPVFCVCECTSDGLSVVLLYIEGE
jgi:hypothetical protein